MTLKNHELIVAIYNLGLKLFFIRVSLVLLFMISLTQCIYSYYLSTVAIVTDWSQRPSAQSDAYTYFQNMKLIGRDRIPMQYDGNNNLKRIVDEIEVWIVLPPDNMSRYAKLLKRNIPILNWQMSKATQETLDIFLSLKKSTNL